MQIALSIHSQYFTFALRNSHRNKLAYFNLAFGVIDNGTPPPQPPSELFVFYRRLEAWLIVSEKRLVCTEFFSHRVFPFF